MRFLGATLWTDYCIEDPRYLAMSHARRRMNDHQRIALQLKPWKRFVPEAANRFYQDSRLFLETALTADPIPTVMVAYHAPHAESRWLPHARLTPHVPSRLSLRKISTPYQILYLPSVHARRNFDRPCEHL